MNAPAIDDVLALADALRDAGVEVGYVGGEVFRQTVAHRLLASDWLAKRDSRAAAAIEARAAEFTDDRPACGHPLLVERAAYAKGLRAAAEIVRAHTNP